MIAARPEGAPLERGRAARGVHALARLLAMLLVPAAIVPVLFTGVGLLYAPYKLWHEAAAEAQRLDKRLQAALSSHEHGEREIGGLAKVSLGPVYGRWSHFPEAGRATQAASPVTAIDARSESVRPLADGGPPVVRRNGR